MKLRWIVVPWDRADSSPSDSFVVECDTIDEAAHIGIDWLQDAWDEKGAEEQVQNVYVAPWENRVAFSRRLAVERSEMQCCGGPSSFTSDGHYATCPNHQREEDEEPAGEER